jgi:hypothetical protein
MGYCTGRGTANGNHCCWISGTVCEFLIDNGIPGDKRFRCGLVIELGDWDKAIADPRYAPLAIHWKGQRKCDTWQPKVGQCCREVR